MLVQIELSPTTQKQRKTSAEEEKWSFSHRCIHWLSLEHQGLLYIELMAPELCVTIQSTAPWCLKYYQLTANWWSAASRLLSHVVVGSPSDESERTLLRTKQRNWNDLKFEDVWLWSSTSSTFHQWFEDVWSLQQLQSLTASACGSLMAPPAHACVISKLCG